MPHDFTINATGLRGAADHEALSIREVLLRIPTPGLATIGDDEVRRECDAAMAADGGILMIGMAPTDVEVEAGRFRAIAHVRLTSGRRMDIQFGGTIDGAGRVEAREAALAA